MCTVLLANQVWPQRPVVVAANRDERLSRPAEAPAPRRFFGSEVYAPLDVEAGGTWMGINRWGITVAVTNRATAAPDPHRRSRGLLVAQALTHTRLDDAEAWARQSDAAHFNPFHLMVASRDGAFLFWNQDDASRVAKLEPGFHVITERDAGAAAHEVVGAGARARPTSRPELAHRLLAPFASRVSPPEAEAWRQILAHRGDSASPMESMTVRLDGADYGTRSASLVEIGPEPGEIDFWWAAGAPDRAPFVDRSAQVRTWVALEPVSGQTAPDPS